MSLVERDAATMILEKDLNGESLVKEIDRIMNDEAKRKEWLKIQKLWELQMRQVDLKQLFIL